MAIKIMPSDVRVVSCSKCNKTVAIADRKHTNAEIAKALAGKRCKNCGKRMNKVVREMPCSWVVERV